MLANFFQLAPVPANAMSGNYDLRLVALSYIVATFASFIALDLTGRLRDISNTRATTFLWLCGGAVAMGAGIWSMHFIGMLAFVMPSMPMFYDPFWTLLSMAVAILASFFALFLLKTQTIKLWQFVGGGIILGLGIASMHYLGMQAMEINVDIHYLPGLFSLSIVIAILASEAALWLALKSNQVIARMRFRLKFISAFIMGAAICGMHYTGMAAAIFTPNSSQEIPDFMPLNPERMSITIAGVTFFILGIAILASMYKEAKNQKMLALARQAGMAEVAASVLHNVGNVLNSINVSANVMAEKIGKSKLSGLTNLSQLMNEHANDLGAFVTSDPKGAMLPNFITHLAEYWQKEQTLLLEESGTLIKNIEHIKNIISMQQSLSKVVNVDQVVEVNRLVEEALLMTGIETNYPDITIEKSYKPLKPVLMDKVKASQILVNLLHNAKDALAGTDHEKKIFLSIYLTQQNKFAIVVGDNGMGIPANLLIKIFSYGFTTKESGHGFGLHSAVLAAKEMGGSLEAKSEGPGKGAEFILELPYKLPR